MSEPTIEDDKVRAHYGGSASTYRDRYDATKLETNPLYPAEYFRLVRLLERLEATGAKRVLDAGCGEGTPLLKIAEHGTAVRGFDLTPEMIEQARSLFGAAGLDPDWVIVANVEEAESFAPLLADGLFDAAVCFGVMPHVESELAGLTNLRKALAPGGRLYVEFRNALFNLFTMNRYTQGYIMDELLADVPEAIRTTTADHLSAILAMDKPPMRTEAEGGKPGYDAIRARMHNPLTIGDLIEDAGFAEPTIHWYHFHPTLPLLEGDGIDPAAFRKAAIAMERDPTDWRGHFLCSAFVVEAVAA